MANENPAAESDAPRKCRNCGCTDDRACLDRIGFPCSWVADDLCSACLPIEAWSQVMPEEAIHVALALGDAHSEWEELHATPVAPELEQLAAFFFSRGFMAAARAVECSDYPPDDAEIIQPAPSRLILPSEF
jgi:hypothetical protein